MLTVYKKKIEIYIYFPIIMYSHNPCEDWKQQDTVIAVEGENPDDWIYSTYPNWDEGIAAVDAVLRQGKAAVIYRMLLHLYQLN